MDYQDQCAARMVGISYSVLMNGLKKANVNVNRKILANIAVKDQNAFTEIVKGAKQLNWWLNSLILIL